MAIETIQSYRLGLKKESVRGTAEASPDKWRALLGDSVLDYALALLPDETKRGINAKFPARAGVKTGTGSIKMPVRASEIGEFLHMVLGDPVSALDSTTLAYSHIFTGPPAGIQPQSYSLFLDRGASMGIKGYSLGQVPALTFNGDQEGLAQMEAEVMFKSEASGVIGSPSYAGESEQFTSYQSGLKIDAALVEEIKSYSVKIENALFPLRTLNNSQDVKDFYAAGPFMVTGSFEVYLAAETERAKFLAGTQSALQLLIEGAVIEDTSKYTLQIDLPKIKYTAFPIGELDGLFGVAAEFEAEYDTASSKLVAAKVINQTTAY